MQKFNEAPTPHHNAEFSGADRRPLEGLHINHGSLDAAADAYEAEYNEAQEARRAEHDAEMRADAFGPKHG